MFTIYLKSVNFIPCKRFTYSDIVMVPYPYSLQPVCNYFHDQYLHCTVKRDKNMQEKKKEAVFFFHKMPLFINKLFFRTFAVVYK